MKLSLKKTVFVDNSLNQFQDSVGEVVNQLNQNPILNGVLLTGVNVGITLTNVNHKLGRKPQGYIVVKQSAYSIIWSGEFTDEVIPLVASPNAITINLWVF